MSQPAPEFLHDFLSMTLRNELPEQLRGELSGQTAWEWLAPGVICFTPPSTAKHNVLLSSGVHGNETAPVEICNQLIQGIANGTFGLNTRVMFIFGNIDAMQQNKRYLSDDLNRLFSGRHAAYPDTGEASRARTLEAVCEQFFSDAPVSGRIHLDLHTAIRGSKFEKFAIAPFKPGPMLNEAQFNWLLQAGIEAILLNEKPAGTFSYHTSHRFGASALTLELGKARPFGQNRLTDFHLIAQALISLITGQPSRPFGQPPRIFKVVGEIEKKTEDQFKLLVADDTENFTAYPVGTILATDKDYQYTVSHAEERIVFPNKTVKPGLRAGLMVTETALDEHLAR